MKSKKIVNMLLLSMDAPFFFNWILNHMNTNKHSQSKN